MEPRYFPTAEGLREWLAANHDSERELLVGFYKKGSGVESIDWKSLVDEVLCYGWIDGVSRRIDDDRFCIRITPRKQGSIWSNRNIARVEALIDEGRMQPAGLRAFEARSADRSGIYSFEREQEAEFTPEFMQLLRENAEAEAFFRSQAPWYQRTARHWVMSAKREATRLRRMNQLIADSSAGRTVKLFSRNKQAPES